MAFQLDHLNYINQMVKACEHYAMNNPPPLGTLACPGEAMYNGWPIKDLVRAINVPTSSAVHVETAFHMRHAIRSRLGGAISAGGTGMAKKTGRERPHSLLEMLGMRMGWHLHVYGQFRNVAAFEYDDVVHIWVITKDNQSVTLDDEAGMFPSDAVITKLRLLEG